MAPVTGLPTMRSLVVMTTYNQAEEVGATLRGVRCASPTADIVVVDRGSRDRTTRTLHDLGSEMGMIAVVDRPRSTRPGAAIGAGLALGLELGYLTFATIDVGRAWDPADLLALFAAVEDGVDLAIGSRHLPGTPRPRGLRGLRSRWARRIAGALWAGEITDPASPLRAFSAAALRGVELDRIGGDSARFASETTKQLVRQGAHVVEVGVRSGGGAAERAIEPVIDASLPVAGSTSGSTFV